MLNLHYTVCYKHNFLVNVDTRQIEFSRTAAKGHFIFWNLILVCTMGTCNSPFNM